MPASRTTMRGNSQMGVAAGMTLAQLRDIAHEHGHHFAAFALERYRMKTGKHHSRLCQELVRLYWAQRRFTDSDGIITSGDTVIHDGYWEANKQPDQKRLGRWLMKAGTVSRFTPDLSANGPKAFKTKAEVDRSQARVEKLLAGHRARALVDDLWKHTDRIAANDGAPPLPLAAF